MMVAKYLWILGSIVFTTLGATHLIYTFFTDKFSSKNKQLVQDMKVSFPILTKETTIWKAWIGFNASHSSGAIFIGVFNLFLSVKYFPIFKTDHFFFLFSIVTIGYYLWLAKKYWFKAPFLGILLTFVCFCASYILTIL